MNGALSSYSLSAEIGRRLRAVQDLMKAHGLGVLVAVGAGAPGGRGWIRYFTGANIWGPRVFLVLPATGSDTLVITRSPDDAEWLKRSVVGGRVESTLTARITPIQRLVAMLAELLPAAGAVGFLNMTALTVDEVQRLREACPAAVWRDLTAEANRIRQIKSAFELTAMRETGRLLAQALDIIAGLARPGARLGDMLGEAERFLRGRGCELGRVECAMNGAVFGEGVDVDRRPGQDDVLQVQLKYAGPLGYWHELSRVFALGRVPGPVAACLAATTQALAEAKAQIAPGASYAHVTAAAERSFAAAGFTVTGRHRLDCHTSGTDETDGACPPKDGWRFQEGMTLAVHPGSLLAGGLGFCLDQTVVVTAAGTAPLFPVEAALVQGGSA